MRERKCYVPFGVSEFAAINEILGNLSMVCFDGNTTLHKICAGYANIPAMNCVEVVRDDFCKELGNQVASILKSADSSSDVVKIILALDGVSPPGKRSEQRKRRQMGKSILEKDWKCQLTAGSPFMNSVFNDPFRPRFLAALNKYCVNCKKKDIQFIFNSHSRSGEGEMKCFHHALENGDDSFLIVSVDNDVIAASLFFRSNISVITTLKMNAELYQQVVLSNRMIRESFFDNDYNLSCWYSVMLFATFGGDYLPALLLSSTLNQMKKLHEVITKYSEELRDINPLEMIESVEKAAPIISLILTMLRSLVDSKVTKKNNKFYGLDVHPYKIVSWFLADLLWVISYYSNSCKVVDRTGFIVDSEEEVLLFQAIPKSFFKQSIFERLSIKDIYDLAFQTCLRNEDWENMSKFSEEIFK